ncbi:MAG: DNA gyrase inhibitor [Clostridiales bacterium]|nr:DNA gyrase inhibitor [Clostridiales bacterium]
MNMKLENIPTSQVAYIRRIGAYGEGNVRTMTALKQWAGANGLMNEKTVIIGIAHDDPQATRPEDCRYDVCLLLPDETIQAGDTWQNDRELHPDDKLQKDQDIHDGYSVLRGEIAGGKYSVFSVKHTAEGLQQAWNEIFPALFKEGYILDNTRPILERYAAEQVERHLCEICIPVV